MTKLHEKKILHKDLKPENIFLHLGGQVKVGDFGLAKELLMPQKLDNMFTMYYAPPEIYEVKDCDLKFDVWSMGCILYEMLTGYTPFYGRDANDVYQKMKKKKCYKPLPEDTSDDVIYLIEKMLTINVDNRPTIKDVKSIGIVQD